MHFLTWSEGSSGALTPPPGGVQGQPGACALSSGQFRVWHGRLGLPSWPLKAPLCPWLLALRGGRLCAWPRRCRSVGGCSSWGAKSASSGPSHACSALRHRPIPVCSTLLPASRGANSSNRLRTLSHDTDCAGHSVCWKHLWVQKDPLGWITQCSERAEMWSRWGCLCVPV